MNRFIYNLPNWPKFKWDIEALAMPLAEVRYMQGLLIGKTESIRNDFLKEAFVNVLSKNIVESNKIDGLIFDDENIKKSLTEKINKRRKNISQNQSDVTDFILDVSENYNKPLTKKRLINWHKSLFPTGFNGAKKIKTGDWRDPIDGEFTSNKVDREMHSFIDWFEKDDGTDGVLRAGIAHIWFITLHPFDSGNGQIARALSDMMLARTEKTKFRFYSLSTRLHIDQNEYFDVLERTQKGNLDITGWLAWFLLCLSKSFEDSKVIQESVFQKIDFWNKYATSSFNKRQKSIIDLLLSKNDMSLTTSLWAKTTKCSQDTALRDIQILINLNILEKDSAGGRSTKYYLCL